jgi:hypothetical protein
MMMLTTQANNPFAYVLISATFYSTPITLCQESRPVGDTHAPLACVLIGK